MSRVKAERPLTKGGETRSRSRDPRALSQGAKRRLDYNNAQVTARKRAAKPRYRGWVSRDDWYHVASSALQRGAHMDRPWSVTWNAARRCEAPVFRTLKGAATGSYGEAYGASDHHPTGYLDMWVPCRRCRPCLAKKAAHWRLRAIAEISCSPRTWFGTLTFDAGYRWRIRAAARSAFADHEWASLSREQQGSALAKEANKYLTLWLKRVRSETGAGFRYCTVWELHKDGTPHAHLLLHELAPDLPVRYRVLSRQWVYGFSNLKLVEEGEEAARYVAKYLAKSPLTRVRASVGYGHSPSGLNPP